jgi:hypothetical protein
MALERNASDKRAVAIAGGAMALVALVSVALVLDAVSGGGERSAASAAKAEREQAEPRRQANPPISSETALWKLKADSSRRAAMTGASWPAGQVGWTVVLSTMYDEEGAHIFAQDVDGSGVDAAVLSTEDFPALGTGVWYVVSGVYADEIEAGEAAAELAATYPGAFTQYVE